MTNTAATKAEPTHAGSHRAARDPAPRRSVRFNWSGFTYIIMTVFLLLAAINIQNNLLFLAFGVAISGIILSGFLSGPALMSVRVSRRIPARLTAGASEYIAYHVQSSARFMPIYAATITEPPLVKTASPALLEHLAGGADVQVKTTFTAPRRGVLEFNEIRFSTAFPFGLLTKSVTYFKPTRILVHPPRFTASLEALDADTEGMQRESTSRPKVGGAAQPAALREYRPGDSKRHVSWRHTARTGQLRVVERDPLAQQHLRFGIANIADIDQRAAEIELERAAATLAAIARAAASAAAPATFHLPPEHAHEPTRIYEVDTPARLEAFLDDLAMLSQPTTSFELDPDVLWITSENATNALTPTNAAKRFLGFVPTPAQLAMEHAR